eukprot:15109143-Ditylum_brightwellii.AAC.1
MAKALVVVAMTAARVVTAASFFVQQQPTAVTTTMLHISASERPQFSGGFDIDTMDALEKRGEMEAALMMEQGPVGILGRDSTPISAGTGKMKKKKKKSTKQKASKVSQILREEGVVKLDGILSASSAASLRQEILKRRDLAYSA